MTGEDTAERERKGRDETGGKGRKERMDGRDEPLANLAKGVEARRNRNPTRDRGELDDAFTEERVGEADVNDPWAELETEDSGDLVVSAPRETIEDDRDVRTIPKSTCRDCPHFGDPPSVHCTHDGTDILTMIDIEQFRVADCPMVVDEKTPLTE
ncbi:hypothetical protein ACFFQF_12460 [Haladaptatus pallidirubidus]|uniref:DUF8135 domain-containing protein n=1 Tax=Haladaptatus pallidirubidus TaxID=1008152 RepID=A0AAV3UEF7_9EURY|nr:hypothetical protein [Haladaptatus pallidirubidus]